jgi:hypothetical protein
MPHDPNTLDPAKLAAFHQQAGPIVARERGLSPSCRIKLAGVARSVGIAEDQIEAAVRSLGAGEPEAPPNPQAERLRERLRKDLAGKTRTIIGPIIEEQIVASAARKYGLDEAQSRQVIGEVAAELGVTRITANEATETLEQQIDAVAGDKTWLPREAWDRLRDAGDKWGLALSVIEELIEERLAANRQQIARRKRKSQLVLAAAGGVIALVAAIVVAISFRGGAGTAGPPEELPPDVTAPAGPGDKDSVQPAWWNVDLAIAAAKAKAASGEFARVADAAASPDAGQRGAGYEQLMDLVRRQPQDRALLEVAPEIAAGSLALEPDEAAARRLLAALASLLPAVGTPLANQPPLELSYWAADTAAAAMAHGGASPQRKSDVAAALQAALGASIDPARPEAELVKTLRSRTALAAYDQLAAAAVKEPATAAARYESVTASAEKLLPADEWLRAESALLLAALPAAGQHWKAYEAAIGRCASAGDPLHALRLADALRRTKDAELSRSLAEQLVLRAGVQPKSWSNADVAAAVRKALGGTSAGAQSAADRWQALQERVAQVQAGISRDAAEPRVLLTQTAELAQLTTLAVALAQGEAGYASFDAAIDQPAATETAPAEESREPSGPPRRAGRALTPSEQRELTRLLDVLASRAPARQVPRESALRALAELAAELPDVPPRAAEALADYLLAAKSTAEFASALPRLAELRRWRHLRLAVADGLTGSKLPASQERQIVAALLDRPPAESVSKAEMRQDLLRDVLAEAEAAAALRQARPGRGDADDSAAGRLQQTFLLRARLLGAPQTASSPAAALELCAAALAEGRDLANEKQAQRYLASDDLQLTAAWQRIFIELSARRIAHFRPERSAAAERITARTLEGQQSFTSVLQQLRDQEQALLELWMLYAPQY